MSAEYHPASVMDPGAQLFWLDGKLCRGVKSDRATLYRQLIKDGVLDELTNHHGLVRTWIADRSIPGYALTLYHAELPFVSYPCEWCAPMLKQAALLVIDLQIELAKRNLRLQDAHPWNVLFDGTRPVFVDVGSIIDWPAATWPARAEFNRWFLNPLKVMALGYDMVARRLLHPLPSCGVPDDLADTLSRKNEGLRSTVTRLCRQMARRTNPNGVRRTVGKLLPKLQEQDRSVFLSGLERLRMEVESILLPLPMDSADVGMTRRQMQGNPTDECSVTNESLDSVFRHTMPSTVLDLGSSAESVVKLAQRYGAYFVALNIDERVVAETFHDADQRRLQILPLVGDLHYPTPPFGLGYEVYRSAVDRFQCDLVLALNLIHRLALRFCFRFDQIIMAVLKFVKRFVVFEFIGADDESAQRWYRPHFTSYYEDQFRRCLEKHCRIIKRYPSSHPHRALFLCEATGH